MFKAKIFRSIILEKSKESELTETFDNALVKLDDYEIQVITSNKQSFLYNLKFKEEDFTTKTYLGNFHTGAAFRLIRPKEISLLKIKSEYNCVSAFSIGSINPDGYAVHFLLFNQGENISIDIKSTGNNEQIQKLVYASIMAIQVGMHKNFLEYSKRVLNLIDNKDALFNFDGGSKMLEIMLQNINLYSTEEKIKLQKNSQNY